MHRVAANLAHDQADNPDRAKAGPTLINNADLGLISTRVDVPVAKEASTKDAEVAEEAVVALKVAVTALLDAPANRLDRAIAWRSPASKKYLMFRQ